MGQTAAEAKREVDHTRDHLSQTLEAIQRKARRGIALGQNPVFQLAAIGVLLGGAVLVIWTLRRKPRPQGSRAAEHPRTTKEEASGRGVARRLLVSGAEAALSALATRAVRRLLERSRTPHDQAHPAADKH